MRVTGEDPRLGGRGHWLRHTLVRDILWVFAFKAVALTALYLAFFGPSSRAVMAPDESPPFLASGPISMDTISRH